MKYSVLPGVSLHELLGDYMLIADTEAAKTCPYTKEINATAAFYFRLLKEGKTVEELLSAASVQYNLPVEKLKPGLNRFLLDLQKFGYVTVITE